ncbi:MAG: hypothetical protein K2I47_00025 [Odoribacter sp.]|nr:hypothetical protein [Odoribacter sp.]
MNKPICYIVLLFAALGLMAGCDKGEYANTEEKPGCVTLKIGVDISDVLPQSRADETVAANDAEKMHTLRIIIVRPDGRVERDKYIVLDNPATLQTWNFETIVSGESKQVYLIVNEGAEKTEDGIVKKVVPYDFSKIKAGTVFPLNEMYALTFCVNSDTERLAGPLPMSDVHRVDIEPVVPDGTEHEIECNLTVRRAAVKFSYYVTNESEKEFKAVGLEMEKMARYSYFLPREFDGEYIVPSVNNNEYYTFKHTFPKAVVLPAKSTTEVDLLKGAGESPVYLLEGKYVDKAEGKDAKWNYKMSLLLQCDEFGEKPWSTTFEYFPDLPDLPRNTHVVVHATVQHDLEIKWEVHVHPYISVPLEPDFGL